MLREARREGIPMSVSEDERAELLKNATAAAGQAYAPYSGFRVGAAVRTLEGNLFVGCNVENASYGLTICAERSAVFAAVCAEGPSMRLAAVAIVNADGAPCPPCGACRQVIDEFGREAQVTFEGDEGLISEPLSSLLPHGFQLESRVDP